MQNMANIINKPKNQIEGNFDCEENESSGLFNYERESQINSITFRKFIEKR